MNWQIETGRQAQSAFRPSLSGLAEWLRANLFPERGSGRVTGRQVLAALLLMVTGMAVSLARTSGPGALNSTWIEDAGVFLNNALREPVLTTVTTQMNGYYDVVPRLVTSVAVAFPVVLAPAIMSIAAAAQYTLFGLVAYIASGPFLRSKWLRLLVAVPACLMPLGYTQANNDLATVQFIAMYGLFWLLLWRPATRAGQVCAPVIMLGATLSSVLPVFYAPVVAARLLADRSKTAIAVAACWAAGLLVQWSIQWRGLSNRSKDMYTGPAWSLHNYLTHVVPRALFGERALGGPGTNYRGSPIPLIIPDIAAHEALIVGACAIVVAVVGIALGKLTAPHWPLAVTALAFSVLVFVGEITDNWSIVQPRYVIAPALLLYAAIVAMLRPRGLPDSTPDGALSAGASARATLPRPWSAVAAWTPVAVFALLLATAIGFNYRVVNTRSESPPWTAVVATAKHVCMTPGVSGYTYIHLWWSVRIPCSRV